MGERTAKSFGRASSDSSVPNRPLFSWAQDEAFLKSLEDARTEVNLAAIRLRRAPHGRKRILKAKHTKALHRLLKLENELARKEADHGPLRSASQTPETECDP